MLQRAMEGYNVTLMAWGAVSNLQMSVKQMNKSNVLLTLIDVTTDANRCRGLMNIEGTGI